MELIQYLNDVFFTETQLLEHSGIELDALMNMQKNSLMPQPSYTLKLHLECDSIFGLHQEQTDLRYYAKNYVEWIATIRGFTSSDQAFRHFSDRYTAQLKKNYDEGLTSNHVQINAGLEAHINSEWSHFLHGVYGLCTKSGLPEDIASKELAVLIISEIIENRSDHTLSDAERVRLTTAVNLLDSASAMFAPHEKLRSSRHRLINQVRATYKLQ